MSTAELAFLWALQALLKTLVVWRFVRFLIELEKCVPYNDIIELANRLSPPCLVV